MPLIPPVGRSGGQEYDVARAIRTFLEQMAGGGGVSFGAAVIKELIQNADDAGATELLLTLDERSPADLPVECKGYGPLLESALLVRNNAPFRIAGEVPTGDQDDFTAICEVAGGHKRFNPTAAGRFGIGFNSVYFVTDTPLLFSRREVHVFDLRHLMFAGNGWRFTLDDFPAAASRAGPIKTVFDWALPKAVLVDGSFQELATPGQDYRQTVFRLPLRRTTGVVSAEQRGPVFPNASFPTETDRNELLREMCEEARRSLLFLKSLRRVVFGGIVEKRFDEWACIEATRQPSSGLDQFVNDVRGMRDGSERARRLECSFRCDVSLNVKSDRIRVAPGSGVFQVTHAVDFINPNFAALAETLRKNEERAVPWVGIAAPLDARTFDWEGAGNARWRVFLPLVEEGPSAAILNAAVFVDPSRRQVEFRTDGSDETLRKSKWNRALAEQLLVPLLREASTAVIHNAPQLVEQEPKKYLSLFPTSGVADESAACLADVVRESFGSDLWLLKLYDVWKEPFDVWVGPDGPELQLEKVQEWLARYKAAFRDLTTDARRFVAWNVGDAVAERLGESGNVAVTKGSSDVADCVLLADLAPQSKDLQALLKLLGEESLSASELEGRWALQREGGDESLLRFDSDSLYLVRTKHTPPVYETLAAIGISFAKAEWVAPGVGLCALRADNVREFANVLDADETGALELLRRAGSESHHDLLSDHRKIVTVIDFLCSLGAHRLTEDLRLAFLVKTAAAKADRRRLGLLFLRLATPTLEEEDLWQGLLREAFAEVDPSFSPLLRRLVDHAPQLLTSLGDDCCNVVLARGNMLDYVHDACAQDPEFVARLAEQLNRDSEDEGSKRSRVFAATRALLMEAERRWDLLEPRLRKTVLALPIHRTADGQLTSLMICGASDVMPLSDQFFLQSKDDLRDAPVELPEGRLLHGADAEVRGFYRRRLGIRERGRIEVLKECLRQIGDDPNRNGGILKYVARYYQDAVEHLQEHGNDGADDLRELKQLYGAARGIPCLDGNWRSAADCIDASPLVPLLKRQEWTGRRLDELLWRLSYPRPVAENSSDAAKLARNLWKVDELDRDVLAELAITSESPDLPIADRVRVIADNLKLVPEPPPTRAAVTNPVTCETLGEPVELENLVLIDPDEIGLGNDAIRVIVPEAADLTRMAAKFTDGRVPVLAAVLRALSVPTVSAATFRSRVVADFAAIWARLSSQARLALLAWLGGEEGELPADASRLDTVFVGEGNGEWVSPSSVIAPSWASPAPPNVPPTSVARTTGVPQQVLRLWDKWCGLRDLEAVVGYVVGSTGELPREQWPAAAKRLVRWLEELATKRTADAVGAALRNLAWVLARKEAEVAFKPSREVLDLPGSEVFRKKFWVAEEKLPMSLARLVRTLELQGSRDVLEAIALCLVGSGTARPAAAQSVYELLAKLTSDEASNRVWRSLAKSASVYRLFRSGDHGPDRVVSGEELFLGDPELKEDFGQVLFCLGTGDDRRKSIRQLYKNLGVGIRPRTEQLVGALSRIPGNSRSAEVHSALVDPLTALPPDELQNLRDADLSCIKVRSCAKTYEPISRCYRDPELDRPSRLSAECRETLIDGRDPANRKLIRFLDEGSPGLLRDLRSTAVAELTREPEEARGLAFNVLDSWRDWLADLAGSGSLVRDEIEKVGLAVPSEALQLLVVEKAHVRFRLPEGSVVVPSEEWAGPELFHHTTRILIRRDVVDRDFVGLADDVEKVDDRIAEEVERLLRANGTSEQIPSASTSAVRDVVRRTLERPGAVLKRMKAEKELNFFHQYLDQTADPEFSKLFDSYRRTSASATEKRRVLAEGLWNLISLRFVDARRTQIRGYGYDEFAIFAELIQNAEDAYDAADQLGLPMPPARNVTFSYVDCDGARTLTVTHYGRPFNLCRYGSKQIDTFRNDVEGVLKSAGSFKPHSAVDGARPIGRFGLGFKSVYLVTDAPRIHSGDWHFEISAGCIPNEIAIPPDYEKGLTRIVLPLTADAREERDGEHGRFADLVPFLRHVSEVHVEHFDKTSVDLKTMSQAELRTKDGYEVDRVEIKRLTHVSGGALRLLRVRHVKHEGQLGLLLGGDGLPVAWSDGFGSDVFAVLPLRVRLGCGVGVSNLFEVQSGRTHLIDPAANERRIAEVAESLHAVVKALVATENVPTGEAMSRFWALWRWDRGDEEARDLRRVLARELVRLTRNTLAIPTLDPETCVKLGAGTIFAFENLPDELIENLLEKSIEVDVAGKRVHLKKINVIPAPTCSAVERVFAAAGEKGGLGITRVGWSELGVAFQAQPWLAESPDLVSAMARSLPPEALDKVRPWLSKCVFRSASGKYASLSELLPPRLAGQDHLPRRLLNLLDDTYDEAAVGLLKQVGLPSRPPLETMKLWIHSGLDLGECKGLLVFLSEARRWLREYFDLGSLLRSNWFKVNGSRATTSEALALGLVHVETLDPDPAFRAWLGVSTGPIQINVEASRWDRPVPDPKKALEQIWVWWAKDGAGFVTQYEKQTYPDGTPPQLGSDFSDRDSLQRESWLSLLLLASLQTMGRTNPEQHRGFLDLCKRRGWMEVFADRDSTAERWIGVLDNYLDTQTNDSLFYHWVRQFVSIYQIGRSLPEYVQSFLEINKVKKPFDLDSVTRPAMNPNFSGGGPCAPPLTRALGIGACFVVRELLRKGVLTSSLAHEHAYVATAQVRRVLARLGLTGLEGDGAIYRYSPPIHKFLLNHLTSDRAHFGHCFDLPFLAIAQDADLQRRFLKCQLPSEDENLE